MLTQPRFFCLDLATNFIPALTPFVASSPFLKRRLIHSKALDGDHQVEIATQDCCRSLEIGRQKVLVGPSPPHLLKRSGPQSLLMFSDVLALLSARWDWLTFAIIALCTFYLLIKRFRRGNVVLEAVVDHYLHESVRNDPKHFRRDQLYASTHSPSKFASPAAYLDSISRSRRCKRDKRICRVRFFLFDSI